MLIDTHCHLDDIEVLKRAHAAGVEKLINIGCDLEDSLKAKDFCKHAEGLFFTAGVHPHEASKVSTNYILELKSLAQDSKCVGIGECGLDYYYNHSEPALQKQVFSEQIALACELNKTLIVHVRDAYEDCLEFLKKRPDRVVIHCFSGNRHHAKEFLGLGCYLSISGIVTFKNAEELREVVRETALDRLLIETDAPYLAPVPFRGKPNEPAYVKLVAEKVAEIKQLPVEEVIKQTGLNARKIFGI